MVVVKRSRHYLHNATQPPAAYAAASNFRLFKDTSRQSNILQSYSKQDVARLYNERQRLLNENRALNGGSISFQGSAFNAINHLRGHAGRVIQYTRQAMESYSFLASPNLHGDPLGTTEMGPLPRQARFTDHHAMERLDSLPSRSAQACLKILR